MNIRVFMNRQDEFSKWDTVKSLVMSFIVFAIVAYVTRENAFQTFEATKSLIFSFVMGCVWTGFSNSVSLFSGEKDYILPRLKTRLFSSGTYLCGTYISQIAICFIQSIIATVIFSCFTYERKGLVFTNANIDILVTFFLVILAADTLGFLIGMLVSKIKGAMVVLPLVLVSQLLFSKGIFELEGTVEKVSNLIEAKFGIAAIGSVCDINKYEIALKRIYPMVEQVANPLFEYSQKYIIECWIHLGVLTIIPMIIAYMVLNIKVFKKH